MRIGHHISKHTGIATLLFSTALLLIAYLSFGAVRLPIGELLSVVKHMLLFDIDSAQKQYATTTTILLHIRLPRAIAAILAGSALALAGATMQGLFRNPLASPDILGISAGSSLGAVIAITTGASILHPLVIPSFSVLGALTSAAFIYLLALRTPIMQQLLFIILSGLALSSLLNGAISATLLVAQQYEVSQFIFWTMGGLEGRLWQQVVWPAPVIMIVGMAILKLAPALNLISLGEENAHGMGINISRTRNTALLFSAIITALAISVAGPIGVIGLMIPHLIRLIFGPNHRKLLPLSAVAGAWFVLAADLIGRCIIAPHEIKVGIITAVIGGSYFVFLIIRIQKRGQLS